MNTGIFYRKTGGVEVKVAESPKKLKWVNLDPEMKDRLVPASEEVIELPELVQKVVCSASSLNPGVLKAFESFFQELANKCFDAGVEYERERIVRRITGTE